MKRIAVFVVAFALAAAGSAGIGDAQSVGDLYTGGLYTPMGNYIDPASLPALPDNCGWYVTPGLYGPTVGALCQAADGSWYWYGDGHPYTG